MKNARTRRPVFIDHLKDVELELDARRKVTRSHWKASATCDAILVVLHEDYERLPREQGLKHLLWKKMQDQSFD